MSPLCVGNDISLNYRSLASLALSLLVSEHTLFRAEPGKALVYGQPGIMTRSIWIGRQIPYMDDRFPSTQAPSHPIALINLPFQLSYCESPRTLFSLPSVSRWNPAKPPARKQPLGKPRYTLTPFSSPSKEGVLSLRYASSPWGSPDTLSPPLFPPLKRGCYPLDASSPGGEAQNIALPWCSE